MQGVAVRRPHSELKRFVPPRSIRVPNHLGLRPLLAAHGGDGVRVAGAEEVHLRQVQRLLQEHPQRAAISLPPPLPFAHLLQVGRRLLLGDDHGHGLGHLPLLGAIRLRMRRDAAPAQHIGQARRGVLRDAVLGTAPAGRRARQREGRRLAVEAAHGRARLVEQPEAHRRVAVVRQVRDAQARAADVVVLLERVPVVHLHEHLLQPRRRRHLEPVLPHRLVRVPHHRRLRHLAPAHQDDGVGVARAAAVHLGQVLHGPDDQPHGGAAPAPLRPQAQRPARVPAPEQLARPVPRRGVESRPPAAIQLQVFKNQLQVFNCLSCPYLFMVLRGVE